MKKCTKCKLEKELVFFPKRIRNRTRQNGQCKNCLAKFAKEKRLPYKNYWQTHNPYLILETKRCSGCKQYFRRQIFNKNSSTKDGLDAECKNCSNKRDKQYALHYPEKIKIYRKNNEYNIREWRLQKRYGLSIQDVLLMFQQQHKKCLICKKTIQLKGNNGNSAHIDHDHKTGTVRGILCTHCNFGIGQFKDQPGLLLSAVKYLQNSPLTTPQKSGKVVNTNTV